MYVAPHYAIFSPLPLSLLQPDIFQAPLLKLKPRQRRRYAHSDRLAGQSRNRLSIPGNGIYFSPLKTVQSIFGIYPASYSVGTWAPTPWRQADLSPPASIESKKIPSCISTLTHVFMSRTVTCLPLRVTKHWILQIFKRQYVNLILYNTHAGSARYLKTQTSSEIFT